MSPIGCEAAAGCGIDGSGAKRTAAVAQLSRSRAVAPPDVAAASASHTAAVRLRDSTEVSPIEKDRSALHGQLQVVTALGKSNWLKSDFLPAIRGERGAFVAGVQ